MKIQQLAPELSVSGQLTATDLQALAEAGFKTVLCARPDGEKPGQPNFTEIQAAAMARGMRAYHLPVIAKYITEDQVQSFAQLIEHLPAPIIAYCGTGWRIAALWGLAQKGNLTREEILAKSECLGHDLKLISHRLS